MAACARGARCRAGGYPGSVPWGLSFHVCLQHHCSRFLLIRYTLLTPAVARGEHGPRPGPATLVPTADQSLDDRAEIAQCVPGSQARRLPDRHGRRLPDRHGRRLPDASRWPHSSHRYPPPRQQDPPRQQGRPAGTMRRVAALRSPRRRTRRQILRNAGILRSIWPPRRPGTLPVWPICPYPATAIRHAATEDSPASGIGPAQPGLTTAEGDNDAGARDLACDGCGHVDRLIT